jgi:hypothetical protein
MILVARLLMLDWIPVKKNRIMSKTGGAMLPIAIAINHGGKKQYLYQLRCCRSRIDATP